MHESAQNSPPRQHAPALRILTTAPKMLARKFPLFCDSIDHLRPALRAPWRRRRMRNWRLNNRCPGSARSRLRRSDHLLERISIDEANLRDPRKPARLLRKGSAGNDNAPICALRRDDAIQFSNDRHAHLLGLPVLALDQNPPLRLARNEIDAAIRPRPTPLVDSIAFAPKGLADEPLKIPPSHRRNGSRWVRSRTVKQSRSLGSLDEGGRRS